MGEILAKRESGYPLPSLICRPITLSLARPAPSPAVVPPHTPHPDGMDGLAVEQGQVLRVHQLQGAFVEVHEQVLALRKRQPLVGLCTEKDTTF